MFLEERRYPPPEEFAAQANAQPEIYDRDLEEFWETRRRASVSRGSSRSRRSASGTRRTRSGSSAASSTSAYNCVDRHVENGHGRKVAFHWEGEPEDDRRDDHVRRPPARVVEARERAQGARREEGHAGRRSTWAWSPSAPIAMLACARLGAPHTFVFGGFSADSLSGPAAATWGARSLITQDEAWRRGTTGAAEEDRRRGGRRVAGREERASSSAARAATSRCRRAATTGGTSSSRRPTTPRRARASRWTPRTCSTSSTRAARRRSRRGSSHTTAGYLVGVATTHHYIFDIKPDSSVLVRGRRRLGHRPQLHRLRAALQRHDRRDVRGDAGLPRQGPLVGDRRALRVDILYTAPTAIRTHMKWGPEYAQKHDLSSLRLLGSVGEPINPEAWVWYREHIGGGRCPVVDTWWQTETGMILITPLPGRDDAEARLGDEAVPGRRRGGVRRAGQRGRPGRRRLPRAAAAVAGDAARDLQATTSGTGRRTGRATTASTSPATARGSTRTATSGCSAASTT